MIKSNQSGQIRVMIKSEWWSNQIRVMIKSEWWSNQIRVRIKSNQSGDQIKSVMIKSEWGSNQIRVVIKSNQSGDQIKSEWWSNQIRVVIKSEWRLNQSDGYKLYCRDKPLTCNVQQCEHVTCLAASFPSQLTKHNYGIGAHTVMILTSFWCCIRP